ncbi:MAG TPA: T9SS type A sorting domain-containing protein [Rubricoccaceae bacterium]|nr:T9SS type A sorting domain-containing protein [Rubricoccaceae bacterium]
MRCAALILASLLGAARLAPPVQGRAEAVASDTLVFERVGDRPIDADDLAFDSDSALWATADRVYRLPPGGDTWEEVSDPPGAYQYVLPLSPDTLFISFNAVRRSLDGGQTWTEVYDEGEALYEAPLSGVLLTGMRVGSGVAYSHDRGATWQPGEIETGTWVPVAEAFAELPEGHTHAGRVVAACWAGLSYSDDGGVTWEKSSLWTDGGRYHAYSVTVGVDGRVYAALYEVGVTGLQIAASADGGQTYEVVYRYDHITGVGVRIVALPGGLNPAVGVLVTVEYDGSVRRSDDGGETWRQVGQVPFAYAFPSSHHNDTILGPDGRLYVAAGRTGPEREWVYRTVGPVVTAEEPGGPEDETGVRLEVAPNPLRGVAEMTYTLPAAARVRVAVYDVLGRAVAVLAEGAYAAGRHPLHLDASALAPGVYALRLSAGEEALTRRFTVVR